MLEKLILDREIEDVSIAHFNLYYDSVIICIIFDNGRCELEVRSASDTLSPNIQYKQSKEEKDELSTVTLKITLVNSWHEKDMREEIA